MRSLQLTSAHNMPIAPSPHSSSGRPPAGDRTSRRNAAISMVGMSAKSQTTTRIEVADVDQGNDTARAVTRQSATGIRRSRTPTAALGAGALRSRADMADVLSIIFVDLAGAPHCRQAAFRTQATSSENFLDTRVVGDQWRAVDLRMPEMNDPGRKASILAAHAGVQ